MATENIIQVQCENCGANINIDAELGGLCEYCGSSYVIVKNNEYEVENQYKNKDKDEDKDEEENKPKPLWRRLLFWGGSIFLIWFLLKHTGCIGSSTTTSSPEKDQNKVTVTEKIIRETIPKIAEDGEMSDDTYNFIKQNPSLFPAKTPEAIQSAKSKVNPQITVKQLNENFEPYTKQLVSVTGQVLSVEEVDTDYSLVYVEDNDGNVIVCLYMNPTGEIMEEDTATVIGVPTLACSYESVNGDTIEAILLIGSFIDKIPQ